MELKEFVKQTLTEIIDGVCEAKEEIKNAKIIPDGLVNNVSVVNTGISKFQKIDFEVSVNVIEKEGVEAKLNVMAAIVGGGMKGENSSTSGYSSKLKFTIPIEYI